MRDRSAVVWTRINVKPVKMGAFYVTAQEARFTYESNYLELQLPGLGRVLSPENFQESTITFQRNEYFDFHPPIQALVPPRSDGNFQRELVLQYLKTQGVESKKGFDTDWEILMSSGHGGIGHIDIFPDDASAVQWYSSPVKNKLHTITDDFGFSLKEFMTWFDHDAEAMLDIIGPTPSVGGAIPKLLLSIPKEGWNNQIALPTRFGDTERTDVVLKFEQTSNYPGIVELESLALDIHKQAEFDVPRHWKVKVGELDAIAVERFDRKDNIPQFTESIYSILASGSKEITNNYSATFDMVGRAIDNSKLQLVDDRTASKEHLFSRFLMSLVTGNGDLHLENLSLLTVDGKTTFSPVYDPTPMRAYSKHNMLSPMPFGNYGGYDEKSDKTIGFNDALQTFSKSLGLNKNKREELIQQALEATKNYPEKIQELKTLPDENKNNLIKIHNDVVVKLKKLRSE